MASNAVASTLSLTVRAPRELRAREAHRVRRAATVVPRASSSSAEDAGSAAGRLAAAAKGFTLAAAASVALLAADPACAELNARGAHRPSPWVPSSPRDTHTNRRCPSQPDNETKHLVPSAHPSPSPSPSPLPPNAEAARGGEFNRGSAQQFGGYDLTGQDVVAKYGADLRLSNFTGAEMRKAKLRGANLTGAYLMKAVAYAADFEGANLSDALMDRAVLVNANFKDAVLTRVVFTSSDLGDAVIEGADFSGE